VTVWKRRRGEGRFLIASFSKALLNESLRPSPAAKLNPAARKKSPLHVQAQPATLGTHFSLLYDERCLREEVVSHEVRNFCSVKAAASSVFVCVCFGGCNRKQLQYCDLLVFFFLAWSS
jgi:hypothetical protein